jgi:hypothetical protein
MKTTKYSKPSNRFWKTLAAIGIIVLISMISISAANLGKHDKNDVLEATLSGTVFHAKTGQPLPRTLMMLSFHDQIKTTETDNSGNYMFKDIPICFCLKNLSAHRDGFKEWFRMIVVNETSFENIFLEPDNSSNVQSAIELSTDKSTYELGENITIYMTNVGNTTLEHPNGYGGATIMDADGNIVFNGWAVDTGNSSLRPNQKVTVGTWDQRDNENVQVQFGTYVIKKEYGGVQDTTAFTIARHGEASAIQVYTDQDAYGLGDCVAVYVTNIGNETLYHPNGWGGFTIVNSTGKVVFEIQVSIEMITYLPPGETTLIGTWELLDNSGDQVQPGTYTIIKEYGGSMDTMEFEIRNYFIPIKGDITGIITDAKTNNPLPDTTVTLEYHGYIYNSKSDSNGWYSFKDVSMCYCLKNISVSKIGYVNQSKLVKVLNITFANFSLESIEDNNKSGAIKITTDKNTYALGEPITIYMTNVGNTTLTHPTGWQDYKIKDILGNTIFIQNNVNLAFTMLIPEKTVTIGTWDQVPDYDQEIEPGTYIVEKEYGGCKDNSTFIIIDSNRSNEDFLNDKEKDSIKKDNINSVFGSLNYNLAYSSENLILPASMGLLTITLIIFLLIFMVYKKKKLKQTLNQKKNIHQRLKTNIHSTQMVNTNRPPLSIIDWHQPGIENFKSIQQKNNLLIRFQ